LHRGGAVPTGSAPAEAWGSVWQQATHLQNLIITHAFPTVSPGSASASSGRVGPTGDALRNHAIKLAEVAILLGTHATASINTGAIPPVPVTSLSIDVVPPMHPWMQESVLRAHADRVVDAFLTELGTGQSVVCVWAEVDAKGGFVCLSPVPDT
jgi:hypothetical protein